MRHPTSREQLTFERREYRANPIEGPESNPDFLIVVVAVIGLLTAIVIAALERL